MSKGQILSLHEKGQIDAYAEEGYNQGTIAAKIVRSRIAVRNYLGNRTKYGARNAITPKLGRCIVRDMTNKTVSLREICNKNNNEFNTSTLSRWLKSS